MTDGEDTRSIDLPEDLVSRVEARLPRSEFDSADAYVAYVLEDLLYHLETETDETPEQPDADLEERLKSLGYLNE